MGGVSHCFCYRYMLKSLNILCYYIDHTIDHTIDHMIDNLLIKLYISLLITLYVKLSIVLFITLYVFTYQSLRYRIIMQQYLVEIHVIVWESWLKINEKFIIITRKRRISIPSLNIIILAHKENFFNKDFKYL